MFKITTLKRVTVSGGQVRVRCAGSY